MATHRGEVLRNVHTLLSVGTAAGLTDGQLLDRYAHRRGASAELAFAALVERHGAMVFRVCRRVLRDVHEAEDAFQATFLVLARRAGSIREHGSVGSWLYGVALRVSSDAKDAKRRRQGRERRAVERAVPWRCDGGAYEELGPVLHEELGRLPERLRAPLVLCYLEGLTHEQAAEHLGCPVGTVRSRLARGRERLGGRLARRGLAPSTGLLVACLSERLARAAPEVLVDATVRAAVRATAGQVATAGTVPAAVTALTEGVLKAMFLHKLKATAAALLAVGTLATGVAVGARQATDEPAPDNAPTPGRVVRSQGLVFALKEETTIDALCAELEALLKKHGSVEVSTLGDLGITVRINGVPQLQKARPLLEEVLKLGGPIRVGFAPSQPKKAVVLNRATTDFYVVSDIPAPYDSRPAEKVPTGMRSTTMFTNKPADAPSSARDQERRLRDVERKLDQLMKLLGEAKAKTPIDSASPSALPR